jgi:serine/threonine protein kinase
MTDTRSKKFCYDTK